MDLSSIGAGLRDLLGAGGLGLAEWFVDLIMAILRAAILGTFGLVAFMILTWIERKVIARMQDRLGPTYAGPAGILQPIADGIKMMTKEDMVPEGADRWVFNIAPVMAAVAALIVYAVIPFGPDTGNGALVGTGLNIGIFYILSIGSAGVIANLMAGWGSNNKYALLGAFRGVAQLISYEVPQILSLALVVMLAGSMDMIQIVNAQTVPFILPLFVSALVFLISGVAETGRTPFDLLEAESEIVAGYHIEYSAMKFSMFFLGEFVHAFALSSIFTTLFLNGYVGFGPVFFAPFWFILKSLGVYFILMWLRGTLPRFRIDQVMAFNWKFLVPVTLVNILMIAIGDKVLGTFGITSVSNPWGWGLILFAANLILLVASLGLLGRASRPARTSDEAKAAASGMATVASK